MTIRSLVSRAGFGFVAMLSCAWAHGQSPVADSVLKAVELTNVARKAEGLPPLKAVPELMATAQDHAEDMAKRGYFKHDTPEGTTPSDRAKRAGYPSGVAENIYWSSGSMTPKAAIDGWLKSPGHRRNMLGNHREIGLGLAKGSKGTYWVMVLGSRDGVYPVILELDRPRVNTLDVRAYVHGHPSFAAMRTRIDDGEWSGWGPFQSNMTIQFPGPGVRWLSVEIQDRQGRTAIFRDDIVVVGSTFGRADSSGRGR